MYRNSTIIIAALALLAWSAQVVVTSAWNQTRAMRDGTAGGILYLDAQDGSTACEASLADFAGSTDATADLTCAHTGEIIVSSYTQATVTVDHEHDSGTAVVVQCDHSEDHGSSWRPVMEELSTGAKDIRTWTTTTAVSGGVTNNFGINYELLRCRAWVTGGAAADTVQFGIVLAK